MDYSRQARLRYHEVQFMPRWADLLFGTAIVILASAGYLGREDLSREPGGYAGLLLAVTAVAAVWLIFRRLEIALDDENLSFGFWRFRPVVPLQDIASAQPEKITFLKYGGIGIRWGPGAVCYNTRFGEGVRIRVKGRKRDWVFSCDDAPRLLALLDDAISRRGHRL